MPGISDSDAILAQFNLLMGELLGGSLCRSKFQPWEIGILLDVEACDLSDPDKREALSDYQNAVQAELEKGARLPQRFSEYLERREPRRMQRKPAKKASRPQAKSGARVR